MRRTARAGLAALLIALAPPAPAPGAECPSGERRAAEAKWVPLVEGLEFQEIRIRFGGASMERIVAVRLEPARFHIRLQWQAFGDTVPVRIPELARRTGAVVVLNGGYFDEAGRPMGFFLAGGKVYNRRVLYRGRKERLHFGSVFYVREGSGETGIAERERFEPAGVREALQAGPHLVRGGRPVGGLERYREFLRPDRRTVIALDARGRLILLVSDIDGRGISWCELQEFLSRPAAAGGLEVAEAMNLDGGSSSQLLVQAGDRRRHLPGRLVPALIAVIPR